MKMRKIYSHITGLFPAGTGRIFVRLVAAALAVAVAAAAWAVPAKRGVLTVSQPDGTTLRVRLTGDEWNHAYMTEDSLPLIEADGGFRYAAAGADGKLTASPMRAADIGERSQEALRWIAAADRAAAMRAVASRAAGAKCRRNAASRTGLFNEATFPSKGKQKGLVILVEYQDVKFNIADPHDYFSRMLNETGFADYGANGSARDYFLHSSAGQFDPEFTVLGPVTLANDRSYYGGNKFNGDDRNPHQMAIEACGQLDTEVDFAEYDRDGDGYIDNVFIFYAGRGEASGGGANTVWPHSWFVTQADGTPHLFDGVILDRYACTNEWDGTKPDGVGTFCHEFSHVLGLPDLYATARSTAFTPGDWDILDHGSYNNDSRTPPAFSSFERYALGWIDPLELTGAANVTLKDISTNSACIIATPDEDEFYLLENRAQKGWDAYIPGHGMLIWHIHYDPAVWLQNSANNDATHQHIDLVEADNNQSSTTRGGDSFPGTAGVTSFGDDTTPAMSTWCGARLNLPLTDIAETFDAITFKVAGGEASLSGVRDDASGIGWCLSGSELTLYGAESYTVADTAGRIIAHGDAATGAESHVTLPAPGIYMVLTGVEIFKISVQ